MKLNLEDRKWSEFFIGGENGIFNISSTSSGIDKNKLNLIHSSGFLKTPYVTRTDVVNGINIFIPEEQDIKYKANEGNVITIGLDTQTVFYQPYRFYTGQNIQILKNENINKFTANFIIPLLKVQMRKFNWGGNGATLGRLNRTKIVLPINKEGMPDWLFMEEYSHSLLEVKKNDYIQHCKEELSKLKYQPVVSLADKKWDGFVIEDIADIFSGRDIYDAERFSGKTPYISSTSQNNGIGNFVGNNNKTLEKNCLSVNRNGSVGYSFYHPYEGLFSNDCRKLKPKSTSKYVGFFLSNQITRQREKYNYGYKMGTARLKRQKIMLPVNDDGKPDYEYMSQYIINLEYLKRKKYLDYLETAEANNKAHG